jgi:hypothetical protein
VLLQVNVSRIILSRLAIDPPSFLSSLRCRADKLFTTVHTFLLPFPSPSHQLSTYRELKGLPPLRSVIITGVTGEYWRFHEEGLRLDCGTQSVLWIRALDWPMCRVHPCSYYFPQSITRLNTDYYANSTISPLCFPQCAQATLL